MKEEQLLRVLYELMLDARQSDRLIAAKLGVSQPTVTRARIDLEKKQYINGYTAIPSFPKIGYEIIAITFTKMLPGLSMKERTEAVKRGRTWARTQPNIVFAAICTGMDLNGVMVSFHRNYSDYVEFMHNIRRDWAKVVSFAESIMIHMEENQLIKPLELASLLEHKENEETS